MHLYTFITLMLFCSHLPSLLCVHHAFNVLWYVIIRILYLLSGFDGVNTLLLNIFRESARY